MEDSGHFHQNGVLVCADSAGSGNLQFTFLGRMLIDYLFSPHLNFLSNACYRGFLKIGLMRISFFSETSENGLVLMHWKIFFFGFWLTLLTILSIFLLKTDMAQKSTSV